MDGKADARRVLTQLLSTALRELLDTYGVAEPEPVQVGVRAGPGPRALAATLGFIGAELRGTLTLIASEPAFAQALPPEVSASDVTAAIIADWAAECSNQLMGRLKAKLVRHGAVVEIGVPSIFRGDGITAVSRRASTPPGWVAAEITTRHGRFEVWVDAEYLGQLDLRFRPSITPPASEGDALFF